MLQNYQGQDFEHLPGYLQLKLHYHLLHLVQKQGLRWDHESHTQEMELIPLDQDEENTTITRLSLNQLLQGLQPQERLLIKLLGQQKTQAEIAQSLHCCPRTLQRKISRLRNNLQKLAN